MGKKPYQKIDVAGVEVMKIENDINGNRRYVIHFLSLGIDTSDYDNINKLYGFKKYRSKSYGGGVVFTAVNLKEQIYYMINEVKQAKKNKRNKALKPHIIEARKISQRIKEESDIKKAAALYERRNAVENEINRLRKEYAI